MVDNYTDIMAQMPKEPEVEEKRVNPYSAKLNVELEVEEDEKIEVSWVSKGNKR